MQVLDLKQVEDRYWILDQELDDVWSMRKQPTSGGTNG
jgi:hypothetical protein